MNIMLFAMCISRVICDNDDLWESNSINEAVLHADAQIARRELKAALDRLIT